MQLKVYAVCDKGCVRENNEDKILLGNDIFFDDRRELTLDLNGNKKFFVAVADGMGGHNAGEVASGIVLERFKERIELLEENLTQEQIKEKMELWAREIHQEILNEGTKDINRKSMGSTLIGVLFYENKVYYINVGDSRLYRFRNGYLTQISRDHSLREATDDENIPSNILINSFGGGQKIFIDFAPVGGKILKGDTLLLCSDGLSGMVSDDEIERILGEENPIDKLLNEAKKNGGEDNISIVLVIISEDKLHDRIEEQKGE